MANATFQICFLLPYWLVLTLGRFRTMKGSQGGLYYKGIGRNAYLSVLQAPLMVDTSKENSVTVSCYSSMCTIF